MKTRNIASWAVAVITLSAFASASRAVDGWADGMIKTPKVDFGVIATGSEAKKLVEVQNIYNQTVHISSVRTTCGCSAATVGQTTVQPGETAFVEVAMNTRKFKQRKDSNLIIQFDAPQFSEVRVPITAYIRTDVVFDPGMVRFGNVDYGKSGQAVVKIAYAGRPDWEIVDVRISNHDLTVDRKQTNRSAGRVDYDLTVTLSENARAGQLRDLVTLVTNDQSNPYVPLMVEGTVVPDITVTPSTVNVRALAPGQTQTVQVVIKGKQPFIIEDVDCEGMADCFKAEISDDARPVHVVPIEFNAPNKPGKFSEEMVVKIAGRSEPLKFRVTGLIN
ncbi:MAG: DUF1573 domain-containing protein [Planctomycetaceae bacterium]